MSLRDIIIALIITASWGLHVTIIRMGALEIPPLFLLSIRFVLTMALFVPFITWMSREKFKNLTLYALPYMGVHLITLFVSLSLMDAGFTAMLLQTELPFVVLIGWFFLNERFGFKTAAGLILAFIGALILVYSPEAKGSYLGVVLTLISALAWAIGAVRMKYMGDISLPNMIFYSYAVTLPIILVCTWVFEANQYEQLINSDHLTLGIVLFYQVCLMSVAQFFWKGLMVRNPAYKVTVFVLLCAVFTVLSGVILLDEKLTFTSITGGLVTMAGVAVIVLRKRAREEAKTKT